MASKKKPAPKYKARKLACAECGGSFSYAGKGAPKYCPAHRRTDNLNRAVKNKLKTEGQEAADELKEQAVGPALAKELKAREDRRVELAPRMLAVELHSNKDFRSCVRAAGLSDLSDDVLKKAWQKAKKNHQSLSKLEAGAIGSTLNEAIARLAVRALEVVPHVMPPQIPGLMKALVTGSDAFGGSSVSYTQFALVVEPPDPEDE